MLKEIEEHISGYHEQTGLPKERIIKAAQLLSKGLENIREFGCECADTGRKMPSRESFLCVAMEIFSTDDKETVSGVADLIQKYFFEGWNAQKSMN